MRIEFRSFSSGILNRRALTPLVVRRARKTSICMGAFSSKRKTSKQSGEGCPFCNIVSGAGKEAMLYQDDEIAVIQDRSPAAVCHLLVIPKAHVATVNGLTKGPEDYLLMQRMIEAGKTTLQQLHPKAKQKMGFHRPPFSSVEHLHMHCFALPHRPAWLAWKYWQGFPKIYMSADTLLQNLKPEGLGEIEDRQDSAV